MKQDKNVQPTPNRDRTTEGSTDDQLNGSVKQQNDKNEKIVPPDDNAATNTGGSMSEGNLSNSRYSRERTRSFHDKTTIMGSDTDGQAN